MNHYWFILLETSWHWAPQNRTWLLSSVSRDLVWLTPYRELWHKLAAVRLRGTYVESSDHGPWINSGISVCNIDVITWEDWGFKSCSVTAILRKANWLTIYCLESVQFKALTARAGWLDEWHFPPSLFWRCKSRWGTEYWIEFPAFGKYNTAEWKGILFWLCIICKVFFLRVGQKLHNVVKKRKKEKNIQRIIEITLIIIIIF